MSESKVKENNTFRPPVVAILGHVNHGKTTILDNIRKTNVQSCEVGGITQKISVFTVNLDLTGCNKITFVDTPGHEAFDLMRVRGGNVADIVLLIVAANDGVMPQTKESIDIINRSTAKPIIVINKIDMPGIDIAKIKRDLANNGLSSEDMGGKVPVVEVSGKTGKGIKELLDMIKLVVEVEGLQKRSPLADSINGSGMVLESIKDKSQGFVSTVVMLQGSAKKGDLLVYQSGGKIVTDRIKGFISEESCNLETLEDGCGGKVIGLSSMIDLGSTIITVSVDNKCNAQGLYKSTVKCIEEETCDFKESSDVSKEDMLADFFGTGNADGVEKKNLNIILASSSEGSLEAIKKSIAAIESEQVSINIKKAKVGDINNSDIELAKIQKSIILGFEVSMECGVHDSASKNKVLVRTYDIIYKLIDEIKDTVDMLESGQEIEEELGNAEIRQIFVLSNGSKVFGCRVKSGYIKRGERIYIVRGDDIIAKGKVISMKHEKTEVNQAKVGDDFGAIIDPVPTNAIEGDKLFCFTVSK